MQIVGDWALTKENLGRYKFPSVDLRRKAKPSPKLLREKYSYDPKRGIVTLRRSGNRVGALVARRRYRQLYVDGQKISEHIVIWVLMTGRYPKATIDHNNRDGLDNRWKNLREATQSQQNANRRGWSASGLKGVSRKGTGWRAEMRMDGKTKYLGIFQTSEEASAAVTAARKSVWAEFAS